MPLLGPGAFADLVGQAWSNLGLLATATKPALDFRQTDGVPIILGAVIGAFAGLLVGFILARLVQFLAYLVGKDFEGKGFIVICTIAGAVLMAWLAAKHG